ncbi:hypothetical protein EMPG_11993 [Blastomyces silverae]|uniref:Uncharacterized protein n=1 Tax=Blastomyces silverae TaxID=2060906 RepID=A0A0H1BVE5_9EURO|nr:hypothetical protein EMPG_11993 [Blastomyces silverae]
MVQVQDFTLDGARGIEPDPARAGYASNAQASAYMHARKRPIVILELYAVGASQCRGRLAVVSSSTFLYSPKNQDPTDLSSAIPPADCSGLGYGACCLAHHGGHRSCYLPWDYIDSDTFFLSQKELSESTAPDNFVGVSVDINRRAITLLYRFDKMSRNSFTRRYSLRPVAVRRSLYIGFPDESLTEEQKWWNEDRTKRLTW